MKLSEGIKLQGKPAIIPECSRNDLPKFFKSLGFKVGVEVGVFEGEYSEILAKAGLKVYSVDPWIDYDDCICGTSGGRIPLEKLFSKAKKRLDQYSNVTIVRKPSMEAVGDFENESLDFVYIDANHHFKYVAEDIYEWSFKIKKGGIICGHDYAYFHHRYPAGGCQVREIVDAFAIAYDLNFWILGAYRDKVRDRFRSWMFIKNWSKP